MKIKPNEIYTINKSNFASQANVMARICTTLKYAEKEPIDPHIFLEYVSKGLAFNRCVIFVTFNDKIELNCCVVMFIKENPIKGRVVWIEWAWSDGKNLSLGKKVFETIEDLAQRLNAKRIACAMTRGLKAVYRRFGLTTAYTVVEKIVKGSESNVEKN